MNSPKVVLVTGAAGYVGADTVDRLVRLGHHVIALVHSRAELITNSGRRVHPHQVVHGDVRAADFGLDAATVAELGARVDVLVHGAAVTDFGLPEQRYTELNVGGTANALDLARRWGCEFLYVSTAYVCGEHSGVFAEDQLDIGQRFGNDYETSKFRAEGLVRTSGARWSVVRPGIVSGDLRTGHSRDHKHIYHMLKLIVEGKLRTLPGHYGATLALSPIGHVADTVAAAAENFCYERTFHAVGATSISVQQISDILAEYPCFRVADFVPPSTFSIDDLEPIERGYYQKVGVLYASYLSRRPQFDCTNTRTLLGITPPQTGAGYFRRILDSCLRTGYLGRPEPSVADVLAALKREGRSA